MKPRDFVDQLHQNQIVAAIREAEQKDRKSTRLNSSHRL